MNHSNLANLTPIMSQGKFTDELMTIDSPRRKSLHMSRMYNTAQLFRNSAMSKNSSSKLNQLKKVWGQSASSMTRQASPAFRFTSAQRFSTIEKDERKNRLILKLNLREEITKSGISFAKAVRNDHFKPKKDVQEFPAPSSYFSQTLVGIEKPTKSKIRISNIIKISSIFGSTMKKGITFEKSQNPQKIFLHHGQNLPYQPQQTLNNPGVGKYQLSYGEQQISNKNAHKIGIPLKKFNQYVGSNPGPGAYGLQGEMVQKRCISANTKGTFQLTKRKYLVEKNPQQYSPGPNSYTLKRFLQK